MLVSFEILWDLGDGDLFKAQQTFRDRKSDSKGVFTVWSCLGDRCVEIEPSVSARNNLSDVCSSFRCPFKDIIGLCDRWIARLVVFGKV